MLAMSEYEKILMFIAFLYSKYFFPKSYAKNTSYFFYSATALNLKMIDQKAQKNILYLCWSGIDISSGNAENTSLNR